MTVSWDVDLPDEGNVRAHRTMLAGALVAEEDADVRAAPLGVLALAVEALLAKQNAKNGRLVSRRAHQQNLA